MTTTVMTKPQLPLPIKATRKELLQAGAKRIMGVARTKRLDSAEALALVIRWGTYIDQTEHPAAKCGRCTRSLVWDSIHSRYNHEASGHQWCHSHSGGTAIV